MEELNKLAFFQSFFFIKIFSNRLELFKIINLVLDLFLLKLRVIFDFFLGYVNKNSKLTKNFLKKHFKLSPRQKSDLILIFIIVSTEPDPLIKKRCGK